MNGKQAKRLRRGQKPDINKMDEVEKLYFATYVALIQESRKIIFNRPLKTPFEAKLPVELTTEDGFKLQCLLRYIPSIGQSDGWARGYFRLENENAVLYLYESRDQAPEDLPGIGCGGDFRWNLKDDNKPPKKGNVKVTFNDPGEVRH